MNPKIKVRSFSNDESDRDAEYLGLLYIDQDLCAVVKYKDNGMFLDAVHPSRVSFIQDKGS